MERITRANCVGPARYGHEFRYRLAAGFVEDGDTVLDAACGTGYGAALLGLADMNYLGADSRVPPEGEFPYWPARDNFFQVDLQIWTPGMDFFPEEGFDVFLGFETIEHLANYDNYVQLAQGAREWILVSAPVVPTVSQNPHHVHDFEPGQLREIFENEEWEHYQTVQQPSELSEIVVLRRRV